MPSPACHPTPLSEAEAAARTVAELRRLGVKRVAGWCGKSEFAVYQWIARLKKGERQGIPFKHIDAVRAGSERDNLPVELRALWPSLPEAA